MKQQPLLAIVVFCFINNVESGVITYSNLAGSTFSFSQISETSAQNMFLSGTEYSYSGMPSFAAFRDPSGFDYIKFSPTAGLTRSSQGWSPYSGSTRLNLMIGSSNSMAIPGAKIRMEGTARIREPQTNSVASFYLDTAVYLEVFGLTGTTALPSSLSKSIQLSPFSHETPGIVNWAVEWQSTNLESLFSDPVFNSPSMKISKLSLSINPFFELNATNQAYAEFYVNQLQIAVIPESTSATLFVFGSSLLLLRRRKARSSS